MLLPLTRRRTSWAAYCDACLVGSPVITVDDPQLGHLARAWAAQRLGGMGWFHVAPDGLGPSGREMAATSWTGETFCFECAGNMRMRRRA